MDWFAQYTLQRYRGKIFSLAFYREKEEVSEAKMDDSLRALLEIMYERLGVAKVIFEKNSTENIDFYVTEDTMEQNLNEKRRVIRKRRDIMQKVKSQARLDVLKDSSVAEKEALSNALKKFVV